MRLFVLFYLLEDNKFQGFLEQYKQIIIFGGFGALSSTKFHNFLLRCDEQLYLIPIVSHSFSFSSLSISKIVAYCLLLFVPRAELVAGVSFLFFLSLTVKLITRLVVLSCILQYIIIDSEADHQSVCYLPWHLTLIGYEPCAVIAQNCPPLLLNPPGNSWTSPSTFLNQYCITLNSFIQYLAKYLLPSCHIITPFV